MTSIAVSTPDGGGSRTIYRTRARRRPIRRVARRAPVRRRSLRRPRPRVHRPLSRFTLANINPFDSRADGAKVPDSNTYPSIPLKIEDEFTLTTDAVNGLAVRAFRPYVKGTVVSGTASGASSWTWAAAYGGTTDSTRQNSVQSNTTFIRPVAHGIRLYAPTAPTSTTGFVHVCIFPQSELGTTWAFPSTISAMNNAMFYQRFPLAMLTQKSVTVVNKFLDVSATRYVDPASDVAAQATDVTFQTEGWAAIIVAVESTGTSTNALVVESLIHLEGIPWVSGVNAATPAAPFSIQSLESVSRMAGQTPAAFVQGEEETYFNQAAQAAGAGMRSVLNSYVGPVAYAAGRYAANAGLNYVGRGISGVTSSRLQSGFRGGLMQLGNDTY